MAKNKRFLSRRSVARRRKNLRRKTRKTHTMRYSQRGGTVDDRLLVVQPHPEYIGDPDAVPRLGRYVEQEV